MRFLPAVTLLLSCLGLVTSQVTSTPIQFNFQDLAAYLNLNAAQLQWLKSIQSSRNQAQQEILQTVNQKQQQLNGLLAANAPDAAQVGQLSIDLYSMRKQLTTHFEPFHSQALAVLTPDQQCKLAALTNALQLGSAAAQAVVLSLIAPLPARTTGPVPGMTFWPATTMQPLN